MAKRDDIALERSRARAFGEDAAKASDVVGKIRAARKLRRPIRWPNTDIVIGIKVLSQAEVNAAQAAARLSLKKDGVNTEKAIGLAELDTVGAAVTVQLLARALYETAAEGAPLLYATADEFAEDVTAAEMSALLDEYQALENEIGAIGELTDAQLDEFVGAAKKKDWMLLNSIAGGMPLRSLRSMAVQLATSVASSSSTPSSSPPSADGSTTGSGSSLGAHS